jgi:hypothetical protein
MRKCSALLSLFLVFLVGTDFRSAAQTQRLSLLHLRRSITGLSPSSGFVGTSVTISGSNFGSAQGSSIVTFNGTAASVTNWTSSSIVAHVPLLAASGNVVVTVNGSASNGVHFDVVTSPPGVIARSDFGFQCGPGSGNCPDQSKSNPPTPIWPSSVAQPGTLRLWDSQVSWSYLMTGYSGGVGTYNWAQLDGYLNDIAAHQPINVNYVFACVPAFVASGAIGTTPGSCGNGTPQGSASPPNDLAANGSPAFTQFVTDLMNHCSAAGNCVKNLITGYELWNEANVSSGTGARWAGTQLQLYQMVAPAVQIIHAQNPNALIFTPSITATAGTWMTTWLQTEVANGIISNRYNIHQYLNNSIPEIAMTSTGADLAPNTPGKVAGWKTLPWIMGETGYDNVTIPYDCNAGNTGTPYSTEDCVGQMVRWNLLLFSNGGAGLYWYYWNTDIGSDPQYATAYNSMMQYLVGGTFGGPCALLSGTTWTCPFTESNGTAALWVWTTDEGGTSFTVPSGYVDDRGLTGASPTTVSGGESISISVEPILLEQ